VNTALKSVVVAVREGEGVDWALGHVVEMYRREPVCVYLLNVRQPFPQYVSRFISRRDLDAFHSENGMQALKHAAEKLDASGIPHTDVVLVGQKATTIVRFAREHHCSQIVLSKPTLGPLSNLILGSVGGQIRQAIGADEGCEICEVY
jgi:nucleotide-binding universal stress UspA family protein